MIDSSSDGPRAWLIRAGRVGERDQFALDAGLAAGGFDEVADLSSVGSRRKLRRSRSLVGKGSTPAMAVALLITVW